MSVLAWVSFVHNIQSIYVYENTINPAFMQLTIHMTYRSLWKTIKRLILRVCRSKPCQTLVLYLFHDTWSTTILFIIFCFFFILSSFEFAFKLFFLLVSSENQNLNKKTEKKQWERKAKTWKFIVITQKRIIGLSDVYLNKEWIQYTQWMICFAAYGNICFLCYLNYKTSRISLPKYCEIFVTKNSHS